MMSEKIRTLEENTSLSAEEAEEFLIILEELKDMKGIAILDEYFDNWSAFNSYEEAREDEQQYCDNDEQTEEQFKDHSFVLSSGRCLVRDYI